MSKKPVVFNYNDYLTLEEEVKALRATVANLEIRCRIAESEKPKSGEWGKVIDNETPNVTTWHYECDQCGTGQYENGQRYCSNCGAKMAGDLISRLDVLTIPVMPREYRQFQSKNIDDAYERVWHDLQDCIEEFPSVVRCKDCKYLCSENGCPLRTWHTHVEDDFCSYGERREP